MGRPQHTYELGPARGFLLLKEGFFLPLSQARGGGGVSVKISGEVILYQFELSGLDIDSDRTSAFQATINVHLLTDNLSFDCLMFNLAEK